MPDKQMPHSVLKGELPQIAWRLRQIMDDRKISSRKLEKECTIAAFELEKLYPERNYGEFQVKDYEIRRILLACEKATKHTPKGIEIEVVEIIAHALKVPMDWLTGTRSNRSPVFWDPIMNGSNVDDLKHLLMTYEEETKALHGWSPFIPCSLESPNFMDSHHRAQFADFSERRRQAIVQKFNEIGNARRQHLKNPKRTYDFYQYMLLSDLERIVYGRDEFAMIEQSLRIECLNNLAEMLTDVSPRITLIVARDSDMKEFINEVKLVDSLIIMGEEFALWRMKTGDVYWSENPTFIEGRRELLESFRRKAISNSQRASSELLRSLIQKLNIVA